MPTTTATTRRPATEPADRLAARIAVLRAELAALEREARQEAQNAFLLAILAVTDQWFEVRELCALAPYAPALAAQLAGGSSKAIGKRLRRISLDQAQAGPVPPLRLLRHPTARCALWKVETVRTA
jgi:hypothetical protein